MFKLIEKLIVKDRTLTNLLIIIGCNIGFFLLSFDSKVSWIFFLLDLVLLIPFFISLLLTKYTEHLEQEEGWRKVSQRLKEENFRIITRPGTDNSILGIYLDTGNFVVRSESDIPRGTGQEMFLISDSDSEVQMAPFYGFKNRDLKLVLPEEVEDFNKFGKRIVATTNKNLLSKEPRIVDEISLTFLKEFVKKQNEGTRLVRVTKSEYQKQ